MEEKDFYKMVLKNVYGLAIILGLAIGSFVFMEIYELAIAEKRNSVLIDRIENKLLTHKFVEGVIHPINKENFISPFSQIPCLVYWYIVEEEYRYTVNGRTQTSYREIYNAKNRVPFEVKTKNNEVYRIFTKMESIDHDYSEYIIPINDKKQIHYELTLKEGDLVSVLIKKDFDPAMIKNEILIYKDTKEAWLSKIKNRTNARGNYAIFGIFFVMSVLIFFAFFFLIRKLKLYVKP